MIEVLGIIIFCLWFYYNVRKATGDAAKRHNEKYKDAEKFRYATEEEAKGCAHWFLLFVVAVIVLALAAALPQQ